MHCPSCGSVIDQQGLDRCPTCGRMLIAALGSHPAANGAPTADAASNGQSGASYTPPQYYPYPASSAPSSAPPQQPAESAGPSTGPFSPYTPYTPYGQPAPSGLYAPPGGYPIAPTDTPASYPYPQPPLMPPLAPLPERKKRRTGLIVGIVALVAVVLAACTWGVVATVQALHLPTQSAQPRETPVPIYDNTFLSPMPGWLDTNYCFQKDDGYHIVSNAMCFAPLGNQSDVDVRVQVHQLSGPTNYATGIVFRALESGDYYNYYKFGITSSGYWVFFKCTPSKCDQLITYRRSSAIQTGIGADNTLEIYVKGTHMDFFVNSIAVGSIDDSSYGFGWIGLSGSYNGECVFTYLSIGQVD